MRSSKSRSRSKSNRPRSIGNIVNRVFDSSGPEGKVRGTPQQIIEKYQFLARDAQLSNDRVAAENFMQHAEHYTRMLAEAQRELAAEQDQRQQAGNGQNGNSQNGGGQPYGTPGGHIQGGGQGYGQSAPAASQGSGAQPRYRDDRAEPRAEFRPEQRQDPRPEPRPEHRGEARSDPRPAIADDVPAPVAPRSSMMDFIAEIDDSGLVETPETRRSDAVRPEFRDRAPRADQRADQPDRRGERRDAPRKAKADPSPAPAVPEAAAEAPAEDVRPRRPRAPRKPRSDPSGEGGPGPAEAAE